MHGAGCARGDSACAYHALRDAVARRRAQCEETARRERRLRRVRFWTRLARHVGLDDAELFAGAMWAESASWRESPAQRPVCASRVANWPEIAERFCDDARWRRELASCCAAVDDTRSVSSEPPGAAAATGSPGRMGAGEL